MTRLISKWYEITWLSSSFKWALKEELIDWIKIVRIFNIYTIYFLAWTWYLSYIKKNKVDIIIDEAWWIPLFSPFFVKKIPIIFFTHHIWDKEWDYKFPFPLNKIGKFWYVLIFRFYKNYRTITVSESTKQELINLNFKKDKIDVIENVLDMKPIENIENQKEDWVVYVGRLMPMKRVEDAILSFHEFHCALPGYIFKIIWNKQDKKYVDKLVELTKKLWIEKQVEFLWNLPLDEKNEIVKKSKACLISSYKEWFWLVVLESNAMWTAVIGYNVPWLKDSIKDWINGNLIKDWDYLTMWAKLTEIIKEERLYKEMTYKSLEYVKNLPWWDIQSQKFENIILQVKKI